MAEYDQILLWETTPDGTVSLSKNIMALRNKVKATALIGGSIIVRPAELFEGSDAFFREAIADHGYLRRLMEAGKAFLALSPAQTIHDRARWRFRDRLVDRGKEITRKSDRDRVHYRTMTRADELHRLGWKPTPEQTGEKPVDPKLQSDMFRRALEPIGVEFFDDGIRREPIGEFIYGTEVVQKRGELYGRLDGIWSSSIDEDRRAEFISKCKYALTIVTYSNYTSQFGGRYSEWLPNTFGELAYGSRFSRRGRSSPEVEIIRSFIDIMADIRNSVEEFGGTPLARLIRDCDASRFAELMHYVGPEHRRYLQKLLHHPSDMLEGRSLVQFSEFLIDEERLDFQRELGIALTIRLKELSEEDGVEVDKRSLIISVAASVLSSYCCLILLPPSLQQFAQIGINALSSGLASQLVERACNNQVVLYGGYRQIISGC